MSAESERASKFTQGKPIRLSTKISKVEAEASGQSKESKQGNQQEKQILATLKAIQTQSQLNSVQSEEASLQQKVDDGNPEATGASKNDTVSRPRNLYPIQCKSCFDNNQVECFHCFKCGELNHPARYCQLGTPGSYPRGTGSSPTRKEHVPPL